MHINSYHAMQGTRPGLLEWVERPLMAPPAGQVRIRVEACGVCHTDAWTTGRMRNEARFRIVLIPGGRP